MIQNSPKIEKYLFPGISGCILSPCTGGPGESSCQEDSEYVWQRGVGSKKSLAFFTPYPPFAIHILNPLDMRIHRDPCTWGKNAPRNAWKQILLKIWAIVDHSVPLKTEEGSTGDEDFDRWVEFLLEL